MRMFRPFAALIPLLLAVSLPACGNKGDLVKPASGGTQPSSAQQPATRAAPDAAKPGQDSGGH